MTDLKKLQNGSDIRGTAVDRENEKASLTPAAASAFGSAFTLWLAKKLDTDPSSMKISVGHDSRITAGSLKSALIHGIYRAGASALDCGLASTPAMFMSTVFEEFMCDGSVMITASHLPYNRNGFKFFTAGGGLEKSDISQLISIAEEHFTDQEIRPAAAEKIGLMDVYSRFLREKISAGTGKDDSAKPLAGLKIIVDAGNGAGGFFVEKVLQPLGANTTGSLFLDPDGMFPNHEPNPENDAAMKFIQDAVVRTKADLGIIFDTDVDRAAVVDSDGTIINRNSLIALISQIILEEHPGTAIVTDSVTSDGLTEFINTVLKGKHYRYKRGYKNVINEAVRLNSTGVECHLAIETSGHGAIRENYFLDDGAYLVVKILSRFARLRSSQNTGIGSLICDLKQPAEEKEFRISLLDEDFAAQGKTIISALESYVQTAQGWGIVPDNHEGVRVSCAPGSGHGWFLMRMSLHDPVIPLNIESDAAGGVKQIASQIVEFLAGFNNIKYDLLAQYITQK